MSLQINCPVCDASQNWLPDVAFCKACKYPLATPVVPQSELHCPTNRKHLVGQVLALWLVWAVVGAALYQLASPTKVSAAAEEATDHGPAPSATPPRGIECIYEGDMVDDEGHVIGACEIILLSKDYVWVQGSERIIENAGDILDTGATVLPFWLRQEIAESPEVVVIGTADARGQRLREETRAGTRGRNLAQVFSALRGHGRGVFSVDLGQWEASARQAPFDDQRRIIIVRVFDRDTRADFGTGLRNAFVQLQNAQPVFKDILTSYSKSSRFDVR